MMPAFLAPPAAIPTGGTRLARYIGRNIGLLRDDPAFFAMKTLARFEVVRDLAALRRASGPDVPADGAVRCALSARGAAEVLRREGYCLGLALAPSTVQSLTARCEAATTWADRDPKRPLAPGVAGALARGAGDDRIRSATFRNQQEDWADFRAIRDDLWIRAVARDYLGAEPCYLRSELAWSFPVGGTDQQRLAMAQRLHCDINDYRTLKFFFYLTDVDAGAGPHSYLPKHCAPRRFRHQMLGQRSASIAEERLIDAYGGARNLVTVTGDAGTGFAGDPYYFHRGDSPTQRARLLLQVEFGRRQYRRWYYDV
jgi:hypothetical protein